MFMIVDRVRGRTLDKISRYPDEALEKLDFFFAGLLEHYHDTYKKGGDFWTDPSLGNLIYGRVKGDSEDKVYIFDLDPYFKTYDTAKPSTDKFGENHFFASAIHWVCGYISIIEKDFKKPVKLSKARKALDKITRDVEEVLDIRKTYGL